MKKVLFLLFFILTFCLTWCSNNFWGNGADTWNNSSLTSGTSSVWTGNLIYTDSSCSLQMCDENMIERAFSQMKLDSKDFNFVDVNWNEQLINALAEKWLNSLPLVKFGDKKVTDSNIQRYIQKIDGDEYMILGAWQAGKENICDDWKDNDWDGKVDIEDSDCNKVKILKDDRCTSQDNQYCDISQIKSWLTQQMFPVWYIIEEVDYWSEKGQELYQKIKEKKWEELKLPVLVATDVDGTLKNNLEQAGKLSAIEAEEINYILDLIPSEWNAEKADKCMKDDWTFNCELAECSDFAACIPEEKGKLDVYMMGYCPYWEIAAQQIPTIQKQFKNDDIDLNIHYIVSKTWEWYNAENFKSLHWTKEVKENMRQLCIKNLYSENKLIQYQQVRYKNADNYWNVEEEPSVAYQEVGIEKSKIDWCMNSDEAWKLLEEDMQFANQKGISASPKWVANWKYEFGWIKAGDIIKEFCKYNEQLQGCKWEINIQEETNWNNPSCGN